MRNLLQVARFRNFLLLFCVLALSACNTTSGVSSDLAYAIHSDDLAKVRSEISKGANVNAKGASGSTPLHFSASRGNLAISKELVEAGAEVEIADCSGKSPLMWATEKGSIAVSRFLLDKGANINRAGSSSNITCSQHGKPEDTPLSLASQYNHADLVRFLLEKGAKAGGKRAYAFALADPARAPIAQSMKAAGYKADEETARMVASLSTGNGASVPTTVAANNASNSADQKTGSDAGLGLVDAAGDVAGGLLLQSLLNAAL